MWQGPQDSRGKVPFSKGEPFIIFAEPLSGGGDPEVFPLRLTSSVGQIPWSAESERQVRDILKQALAPGAKGLMVTGVRDAFHSQGSVPGMSESQFFLTTEGGRPVTLLVTREPSRSPVMTVSSSDLVDRARAVEPWTLLWRGLACGMPEQLPEALASDAGLSRDYAFALAEIGKCGRTLR